MAAFDYETLREVAAADVYKAGVRCGALVRRPSHVEFVYDAAYVERGGAPVATSLPCKLDPYPAPAGAVPAFFAGLLPEGRRLTALRRAVKTSADDEFSLLLAVGQNTIGDVQVVPAGTVPGVIKSGVRSDASWADLRFRDLMSDAGVLDRVGLPGIQEKVSDAMITVPLSHKAGAYLLKLDPPEFPHLVENEAYFLRRARDAGLPVVEAELVRDAEGLAGLLVTRFDRSRAASGALALLAVEDGCQVLGRWPADKYNLTTEQVVARLASICPAGPVALRHLYQQLVFAWLTGNGDVHAKNLSIVQSTEGEWRVAPAYDLPSSRPYGDTTMALSIGGRKTGLSRRRWLEFAEAIDLPQAAATRVIESLLASLEDLVDAVRGGALPFEPRTRADLAAELRNRRRLLQAGR